MEEKNKLIIGIDARGLDRAKTGITTYIEETLKSIVKLDNTDTKYILYSSRKINIDIKDCDKIEIKNCNKKKGTLWMYFELPKMLKIDGVNAFWGTQHLLPMRNKYTKNIKYILTVHDLAIHKLKTVGELKNTIIQRLFLKKSCKNADIIMADSKSTKDDIVDLFKIDEKKINVVYLGTNFDTTYNIEKKSENEILKKFNVADKNYLFFVSTIEPRKNIITLVKAFEVLKENEKLKNLKLILAGGLGWKYEPILCEINNSKHKLDINQCGYITKEEKECLLHNAKCFVYPSLYEGFGLPILEAMSKGTIVVTSNISSLPEVGENAAYYFNNVLDYNELANVIENVLKISTEEKEEKIKLGIEQTKKFTWDKCAEDIMKILEINKNYIEKHI